MVGIVPFREAKKQAGQNEARHADLQQRRDRAVARAEAARKTLDAAYSQTYNDYLVPFAEQFARIKNVELGALRVTDAVPELNLVTVTMQEVGLSYVQTLAGLAGGSVAGAAMGGVTFAAVGALATASTGTAIGTLSGAAATSATLAWLGGGSLATGGMGVAGGTAILTGIVAAPAALAVGGVIYWRSEKAYAQQRATAEKLRQAEIELKPALRRSDTAAQRCRDTAGVLEALTDLVIQWLPQLGDTLARTTDYREFDRAERERLAELTGVASTIAAVISSPLVDEAGDLTALSTQALTAAQTLHDRLAA